MGGNEAFSRVTIDAQLKDAGWKLTDGQSVRFEHGLGDGTKADYVLWSRQGRARGLVTGWVALYQRWILDVRERARRQEPMPWIEPLA